MNNQSKLASMLAAALVLGGIARADNNRVEFELTDEPGRWFKNTAGPIAGTQSLAVATPGVEVVFSGKSHTVHTMTSLLFPTGAAGMPFDTKAMKGSASLVLSTPGLYVFFCKIHPYMLGAVIVDDPATPDCTPAGGCLDLGGSITLGTGLTVPTSSDLATRLLRVFFIATNPSNWEDFRPSALSAPWHVTYPNVNVRITGGAVVNLPAVLNARYGNDIPKPALTNPATPGVGEVWVDTQFELTAHKEKPGIATAVDAATWQIRRKVALPQVNMNNPHNMWTDRNQTLIYQTEWFDSRLTVFDRVTGRLINHISVGEAPAHVMTRVDTDQVHVTLNGVEDTRSVVELSPLAQSVERKINIQRGNPHAHWMSHDGKKMVTPNAFTADSTIYDFPTDRVSGIVHTGAHPIATGMSPDSKRYFVANFLENNISVIATSTGDPVATINLIANYNPISGAISGPVGGLPIQTPVSPDGKFMVTANTLTGTITITTTNTATDTYTLAKMLPCDPGCHGVQFGARDAKNAGGYGYYAYVSSKFSNTLLVVNPDPNNDGNPADAAVVGRVLLVGNAATAQDDTVVGNFGMGGQGILGIPVVYNGWVQKLPLDWLGKLTATQKNPIP